MKQYNVYQKTGESLEKWYRRLAKAADQRLVRLETLSEKEHFKGVKSWSYKRAQKDIKKWLAKAPEQTTKPKSEKLRFNTKIPEKPEDVIAKIKDMQHFLLSPTSNKSQIIEIYEKRTATVNELYKTNFTWEDLATYYETGSNEIWDSIYGSKTALQTIGVIQEKKDVIMAAIEQAKAQNIKIDESILDLSDVEDSLLRDNVFEALNNYGLNIEDLF